MKCGNCRGRHSSEQCKRASGACYKCDEMGHMKKDCPQMRSLAGFASGSGSGSAVGSHAPVQQKSQGQSVGGSNLRPLTQEQVFALNQDQAADQAEQVIAGTFCFCSN